MPAPRVADTAEPKPAGPLQMPACDASVTYYARPAQIWCPIKSPVRIPTVAQIPAAAWRARVPGAPLAAPGRALPSFSFPPLLRAAVAPILASSEADAAPPRRTGVTVSDNQTDVDTNADGDPVTFSAANLPVTIPYMARKRPPAGSVCVPRPRFLRARSRRPLD